MMMVVIMKTMMNIMAVITRINMQAKRNGEKILAKQRDAGRGRSKHHGITER